MWSGQVASDLAFGIWEVTFGIGIGIWHLAFGIWYSQVAFISALAGGIVEYKLKGLGTLSYRILLVCGVKIGSEVDCTTRRRSAYQQMLIFPTRWRSAQGRVQISKSVLFRCFWLCFRFVVLVFRCLSVVLGFELAPVPLFVIWTAIGFFPTSNQSKHKKNLEKW